VTGTSLSGTTSSGFTKEQLYSTASYQANNLAGIQLHYNDLSGWNFNGQNLANAGLYSSTLTNADLSGADTRGALVSDLIGATSRNAILPAGTIAGLGLAAGDRLLVRNYLGDTQWSLGPIPINVQDHLTMTSGGVLQMLFEADPWNSTMSFQPGIPVTLGGTLELLFVPEVDVSTQVGRTFQLFDWTGVMPRGTFAVESPYAWNLAELYTTGAVTLKGVPEPATLVLALVAVAGIVGFQRRTAVGVKY
jgi:hypothetical protein